MEIPHVIAGGVRHSEIARRLRLRAIQQIRLPKSKIWKQSLSTIEQQETKHAYILATYTAMLEFRELLAERQVVRKEMN